MKRKLIVFFAVSVLLLTTSPLGVAQNDAFFYEKIKQTDRELEEGVEYNALSENSGLSFNEFNNSNSKGFDFGNFQFNGEDVTIGSGALLLGSMALLGLITKRKSENK